MKIEHLIVLFCSLLLTTNCWASDEEAAQREIISKYFSDGRTVELKSPQKDGDPFLILHLQNGKTIQRLREVNCESFIFDFLRSDYSDDRLVIKKECDGDGPSQYEIIDLKDGEASNLDGSIYISPKKDFAAIIDYGKTYNSQLSIMIRPITIPGSREVLFRHNQIEPYAEVGLSNIKSMENAQWLTENVFEVDGTFCHVKYTYEDEMDFVLNSCEDEAKPAKIKILLDSLTQQWHVQRD